MIYKTTWIPKNTVAHILRSLHRLLSGAPSYMNFGGRNHAQIIIPIKHTEAIYFPKTSGNPSSHSIILFLPLGSFFQDLLHVYVLHHKAVNQFPKRVARWVATIPALVVPEKNI